MSALGPAHLRTQSLPDITLTLVGVITRAEQWRTSKQPLIILKLCPERGSCVMTCA